MRHALFLHRSSLAALLLALCACAQADTSAPLRVQLPAAATASAAGRLLLFAEPAAQALAKAKDGNVLEVNASPFGGADDASMAAMDIARLAPGQSLAVDTDTLAWPTSFSKLADGEYYVQAVLDVARERHCRIGSSETHARTREDGGMRHCRIGSSEKVR